MRKYSSTGTLLWSIQGEGGESIINAITVDDIGNIYVCGGYRNTLKLEGTILSGSSTLDTGLLASFDLNGRIRWLKKAGSGADCSLASISALSDGYIAITGFFARGSAALDNVVLELNAEANMFIAKYLMNNGALSFAQRDDQMKSGTSIIANESGGWYLSGLGITGENNEIRRYLAAGTYAIIEEAPPTQEVQSLSLDKGGNIYAAKLVSSPTSGSLQTMVTSFGASGTKRWDAFLAEGLISGVHVAGFGTNSCYVGGWFIGSAAIGPTNVSADAFSYGLYVAQLSTTEPSRAPVINEGPREQISESGNEAFFEVIAWGDGLLSYQWYKNGDVLTGKTGSTLRISNARSFDEGEYRVKVSNANGEVWSDPARLIVIPKPHVIVTTIAGSGVQGYLDSESALGAQLSHPDGGGVAADGTVFFADGWNHCIRFVTTEGVVGTYAGQNQIGFEDGPGLGALFNYPLGMQLARNGDLLVADCENNRVRRINAVGFRTVVTLAGSGVRGYQDGSAATAKFSFPNDLVEDASGNIYVSEFLNHTIRKITPNGEVSTVAGNGTAGYADGIGTEARFNQVAGLTLGADGNLYATDWNNHRVRKITPQGQVTTIAGTNVAGLRDGFGSDAQFSVPNGVAVDKQGNIFVSDVGNHTVRQIRPDGLVFTVAGLGTAGFADGDETVAMFSEPSGIAVSPDGSLIVTDTINSRVRKINLNPEGTNAPPSGPAMLTIDLSPAVTIYGVKGKTYRIESTESVENPTWVELDRVTLSKAVERWFDPRPATNKGRIYRAVLVE